MVGFLITCAVVLVLALIFIRIAGVIRYVPNTRTAVVERLWSSKGSLQEGIIALNGEAGFLPQVRRGGIHAFFPFKYRLRSQPLVTISNDEIGYVFARSGVVLPSAQTLASNETANDFQNVEHFLTNNGQKGPQRLILRGGTYAINLAQFVVLTKEELYSIELDAGEEAMFKATAEKINALNGFDAVSIPNGTDKIGVVTVLDGPTLAPGEIIAPTVGVNPNDSALYHNSFQEPEKFLRAGGYRGRQYQVLAEGSYFINRLFATVELVDKTIVEVGQVGVVVSYIGKEADRGSEEYNKHGELVGKGYKGVQAEPLTPGKYAFNPYAAKVAQIQTTNIILKWDRGIVTSHRLDENLKEVSLITSDAFEPSLPLSVVIHIDVRKAPKVVQRFGDVKKLVEQTLDPLVSAYFKNISQSKTIIQLLQERTEIQAAATDDMKTRFAEYDLELVEVLIGTPQGEGIEQILAQLREREIAKERTKTFIQQEEAANQERTLREAQAKAESQGDITRSVIAIEVQENQGKALVKAAQQQALQIKETAAANSERAELEGKGEASRIRQVGTAQAEATKLQVEAFGGPQYQLASTVMARFCEAIEKGKIPIVPTTQVGGGGGMESNAVGSMLGLLMAGGLPGAVAKLADASKEAAAAQ